MEQSDGHVGSAGRLTKRVVLALGLLVVVGLGAAAVFSGRPSAQQVQPPPSASAVPVSITKAQRADVPVWLRGLGTVQALNTVTVRARVDGTLMEVPVTEGQVVKQGTLLAVIDPRPYKAALDQAAAKKTQDEADLVNAKHDLERYSTLAKQSFASHQQVDTQTALVNHLVAAIAGDEATIETAQLNLSFCYITAPFDGRLGLRQMDPGNLVHANDAGGIMTITQVRPISVVFTLPEHNLPPIVEEMAKGTVPVTAWSSDHGNELAQGTLLTPDNAIDTATGTIRLKATFTNDANRLWPGQFVDTRLLLRTEHQVVSVPSQAVQHGPDNLYVYIVKPNNTVQRQTVEAEDRGAVMVITKGVEAGQTIVLDGQSRLQDGMLVAGTAPTGQAAQNGG